MFASAITLLWLHGSFWKLSSTNLILDLPLWSSWLSLGLGCLDYYLVGSSTYQSVYAFSECTLKTALLQVSSGTGLSAALFKEYDTFKKFWKAKHPHPKILQNATWRQMKPRSKNRSYVARILIWPFQNQHGQDGVMFDITVTVMPLPFHSKT